MRLIAVALVLAAALARAQGAPFRDPLTQTLNDTTSATIKLSHDIADRMTVPVMIDGQGPFAFMVDTGADRSVISTELATRLGLAPGPIVLVRSTVDARDEQTAIIPDLSVGALTLHNVHAPMLPRSSLGADGILGVDAVNDQAVVMDFKARRMTMQASAVLPIEPGSVIVNGRNRYGQLILLDASVDGVPVYVILDSGAETSIVNSTFRRRMEDGLPASAGRNPALILSVTGGTNQGQFGRLSQLTLGNMTLSDLPVVFADLYTFQLFNLQNRPAMLLGMDALRIFAKVEVDYPKRRVSFRLAGQ